MRLASKHRIAGRPYEINSSARIAGRAIDRRRSAKGIAVPEKNGPRASQSEPSSRETCTKAQTGGDLGARSWQAWCDRVRGGVMPTNKITSLTHPLFGRQRRMIANDVVDADADGKSHAALDGFAIDFLGVKFGGLRFDDGGSKLEEKKRPMSRQTVQVPRNRRANPTNSLCIDR